MKITKNALKKLIMEELQEADTWSSGRSRREVGDPIPADFEALPGAGTGDPADDPIWDEVDIFLDTLRRMTGQPLTPDLVKQIEEMIKKFRRAGMR